MSSYDLKCLVVDCNVVVQGFQGPTPYSVNRKFLQACMTCSIMIRYPNFRNVSTTLTLEGRGHPILDMLSALPRATTYSKGEWRSHTGPPSLEREPQTDERMIVKTHPLLPHSVQVYGSAIVWRLRRGFESSPVSRCQPGEDYEPALTTS